MYSHEDRMEAVMQFTDNRTGSTDVSSSRGGSKRFASVIMKCRSEAWQCKDHVKNGGKH